MNTPLTDIWSPLIRQKLYLVYSLVALAAGAVQVGFSAAGQEQPVWLKVALSVIAFLGGGLGLTAASNVRNAAPPNDGTAPAAGVPPVH